LFHLGSDGRPEAVFFVNFAKRVKFDVNLKRRIRSVFTSALGWLDGAKDELRRMDATALAEAAKILPPTQTLAQAYATAEAGVTTPPLEAQFKRILRVSLSALGIKESDGLGTIHLYRPGAETLDLAAWCGCVSDLNAARVQDINFGDPPGIAAWVAIRQRAILVNDLQTSRFRAIHVVINKDVKSELAVPMMAAGKLIGVLNIESKKKKAFSPASVRSIWYAANYAAVAYQLETRSQLTRNLLDICATAATDRDGRGSLEKIAKELSTVCDATSVDIWRYDPRVKRFVAAASTDTAFTPTIRPEGRSAYIRRALQPVWLSNITSEKTFMKEYWTGGNWVNKAPSGRPDPPTSVNGKLISSGIKAQLGMPIMAQDDCVGVALIKFKHTAGRPTVKLMKDAFSYVSQVGLVMEAVQWRLEMPSRNDLRGIGENLGAWWSSGKLNFGSLQALLEGYVAHRSFHGYVSGDFYAIKSAGDSMGLLLGDGKGEAVPGLLNALPLMTSFELFGSDTGSTRYVMEKLMTVANKSESWVRASTVRSLGSKKISFFPLHPRLIHSESSFVQTEWKIAFLGTVAPETGRVSVITSKFLFRRNTKPLSRVTPSSPTRTESGRHCVMGRNYPRSMPRGL
jgi:putative methionine-R-sulfoxide reductase with GAF domain